MGDCRPVVYGRAYDIGGVAVDNSWIVPYSPWFSAKYNCHINVECAVSLGSFKYAFKYIQKGGDVAGLEVRNKRDEITRWIEGRYISAAESAWRIFHFDTHDQVPSVVRLQVTFSFEALALLLTFLSKFISLGNTWLSLIPLRMLRLSPIGPETSKPR